MENILANNVTFIISGLSHLLHSFSPAVQRRLESGGWGLPDYQLKPRELRQRPAQLQESQRQHRLTHHSQTSGLCARRAQETAAARHGKYILMLLVMYFIENSSHRLKLTVIIWGQVITKPTCLHSFFLSLLPFYIILYVIAACPRTKL